MPPALLRGVVAVLCALIAPACAASPEEQTLLRFFAAAPTLDSTVIRKYATIGFDPRTAGIVQSFTILAETAQGDDSRDVTIEAVVLEPSGTAAHRTMIARLEKVDGRWLVTGLRPAPASRTARAASSAPPN